ncbi:hypothetical protein ID866_11237, partial [Astraeus odoratus]
PYWPSLTPQASPFQPHCQARDQLLHWTPQAHHRDPNPNPANPHPILTEEDLDHILQVIRASWGDSTKALYGARSLVFHVFCDSCQIPDQDRCPVSQPLLLSFISTYAITYSGCTLSNYVAGLKAWHLLHGHPWLIDPDTLKATIEGATCLAPPSSKHPP